MRQPRIRRIYTVQLRNKFCEMQDLNSNPIILLVYRLFEQSEEIYENHEIFLFENAKNPFPVNDDARRKRRHDAKRECEARGADELHEVLLEEEEESRRGYKYAAPPASNVHLRTNRIPEAGTKLVSA